MGKTLVVPATVIGIIATMILPVPPIVMDFLLVANLLLALVLLMCSLSISEPLKLSALPSILLLATLFRLGLNISTTRLILGTGDAGGVVHAFGSVVIGGNLFVGAVVFLILTLIQFIVIAKGSERVAEVSARFTLDALPGKQMSIDADVRAGLIDFETARQKRQELQIESRFYGALDGSMKFVKGDAIAGLVITAVNIVGGLLMGVAYEGLDMSAAIHKYTLLTVGDGLLCQIPALLNSLCAGMVVTRVTRGDGAALSSEIIEQISQISSVQAVIGIVAILFAFLPGMPALPFLLLGGGLVSCSAAQRARSNRPSSLAVRMFKPKQVPALCLELSPPVASILHSQPTFTQRVEQLRQRIFEATGMLLGRIDFSINASLGTGYGVLLRGISVLRSQQSIEPDGESLGDAMLRDLERVIKNHSVELVDDALTRRIVDSLEKENPEHVAAVIPGVITLTQLTGILSELVKEGVTIRNFDLILQAVAEHGGKVASDAALLEEVRQRIGRIIVNAHIDEHRTLECLSIDPVLDLSLGKAAQGAALIETEVLNEVTERISADPHASAVVVVSRGTRRFLRDLLATRSRACTVLSFEEIPKDITLRVRATIDVANEASRERLIDALAA